MPPVDHDPGGDVTGSGGALVTANSLAVEWGKTPKDKIEDFLLNSDANKYIAKPSFTAGAIGTFVFKKYEELSNGIDSSVDKIPKHLEPNKYVVQEFFDGNLVSIEG
ncbi:hypothetical protein DPO11_29255, partial [Salmonella enterica]|nr:hypothetical protein [Salmonella enterica]